MMSSKKTFSFRRSMRYSKACLAERVMDEITLETDFPVLRVSRGLFYVESADALGRRFYPPQ